MRNDHFSSRALLRRTITVAAVACGLSDPIAAQPPATAAEKPLTLSPFEVTSAKDQGYRAGNSVSGTRIAEPIGRLPFALSAFTPEFIADTKAEKLLDIVSYSPGVRSGIGNLIFGDSIFSIRGFAQSPQRNGFYNSAIANNFVDPAVIERAEVVKGPASLLYGQVSPGGTVNYITKSPTPVAFARLGVQAGNDSYGRTTLDLNRPLVGDQLLFRLNLAYENGAQYVDFAKYRAHLISPTLTWKITPRVSLKADYQWYHRKENAPRQYHPPTNLATATSMVNALHGAGFPSPSSALSNRTGPGFAVGVSDASDPGFLPVHPLLAPTFNIAAADDLRTTDLSSLNVELTARLGDHWTGRANFAADESRITMIATGVANLFLAAPDALLYSAATARWSVAPAWAALSRAQQDAATLAFAQRAVRDPNLLYTTQNGTPAPALISRPPRTSERFGSGKTFQAELAGHYDFGGAKIKPLFGVVRTAFYDYDRAHQRPGNAFRTWDVNPASPTYFVDALTPAYTAKDLTARNRFTRSYTKDEGLYGVLNTRFFDDRLIVIGGARYNRSESQTANLNVTPSSLERLKGTFTTPQVGVGYMLTPSLLLYGSYSTSYTLPTQPFLTQPGTLNGLVVAVPTGPTAPTDGEGVEAGFKTSFLDGRVSATVSAFEIDQNNVVQSLNQTIAGIGVNIIVQGAKVRSRGVEAEITWSPTDNWQVYASASEIDVQLVQVPFGLTYYLGQVPNHTAKHAANLWTRYTFTASGVRGLWVGGGFNYTGKSAGDSRNVDFFMPAYTLWNAAVGYDWKWQQRPMKVALNARNLAGKFYKATTGSAGEPRRLTLSLTTTF